MKMIHYSLVATYVAVLAAVDAPHKLMASDALSSKYTVSAIGLNEPLLAQADSQKAGDKAPKVNVDSNGVILKGYDPVAYLKQKACRQRRPEIFEFVRRGNLLFRVGG
jgi:hypothetical protein